ncbi:hypothetical protein NDU88_004927 [Pleurodeles waltl]|uniref:Uncharacterized protein n=1 Tax=Pleurodeles waltl TaxID=8319 RepID=A0AAV7QDB1_PLEWA|nr:hypothetical protein NDU88_004927 [Pleurodeles waltl]
MEGTRKSGFPQKQKTDFRGGPCLKQTTRKKRRDGDAHQQRTTEDQDTAKEKNVTTKGNEAPRHLLTTTSLEGRGSGRAPERPAILSSDQRERRYPRGTAWDNPEGEDGGNPEIWVPSETKDGLQRRPVSEADDAEEEERRRRTPTTDNRRPRHREGEECHDKGQ